MHRIDQSTSCSRRDAQLPDTRVSTRARFPPICFSRPPPSTSGLLPPLLSWISLVSPLTPPRLSPFATLERMAYTSNPEQIIWAMLFHLIRFSFFMLVVMSSFALAFHSLYSHPNCEDGDAAYGAYRTIQGSMLEMFKAMLGGAEY